MKSRHWLDRSKRVCDALTALHAQLRLLEAIEYTAMMADEHKSLAHVRHERTRRQRWFDLLVRANRKVAARNVRRAG